MDGAPEFFHYFPVANRKTRKAASPVEGFDATIDLQDAHFPLTTRRYPKLGTEYGYLHRHPEFEICHFPRDGGSFMIQDHEYPIKRGDVFIVNANDIHQPILRKAVNEGALVVYFSPRLFATDQDSAQWVNAFIVASLSGRNRLGAQPAIAALMQELHEVTTSQRRHWRVASRGILMHLLASVACEFLRGAEGPALESAARGMHRFARVIEYINANLHERIEARRLYALAALSHSQFSSRFQAAFGVPVSTYIREQRMRRAMRLLQSTSLTATQIALQTGFNSSSFFSTVFKRHTGLAPARYRERRPLAVSNLI
jgi:AraC-like DNA-binding protein